MKYEFLGTKGEWVNVGGDNGSMEVNIGGTTASICRWDKNTGVNVIERKEMEANAYLIASAPDMFEFCTKVLLSIEGGGRVVTFMDDDIEELKALVHKALNITD